MHCYFNVFQHLFNSLNKLCVSICVVHRWGSSELECRRVKRFCLFFRTLQISNFFVLYERLSYASSNEYHVPSSHLKMVVWQCWYWVQLYQSGKRKFHMVLFPAHFTKPLIIPILSIAPISYYIQGHILASHETTHMAVVYVICMTSLLPLVMQRDVLHPMVQVGVKVLVSVQLVELRFFTSLNFPLCLHCHQ